MVMRKKIEKIKPLTFFWICLAILLMCCALVMTGCPGGGNGDDEDDDPFTGGSDIGADEAVVFWRYFGEYNTNDTGINFALDVADDGGFFAAGFKAVGFSDENHNYFILRTDEEGIELWRLTGDAPGKQALYDIKQTPDGGAVAVGYTGTGSEQDVLVVKTNRWGNLEWERVIDSGASEWDEAHAICVLDTGYAIAGGSFHDGSISDRPHLQHDLWFFKIDLNGNKVDGSDRYISQPGWSQAYAMDRAIDGGFVVAGTRQAGDSSRSGFFVARLNQNGDPIWERAYGPGRANTVRTVSGNGFIAAGSTMPFPDNTSDAFIVRIDENGETLWSRIIGGAMMDFTNGVAITETGEFLVAGVTRSYSGAGLGSLPDYAVEDFFLIKLDENGNALWRKVKGKGPNNSEIAHDIAVTTDGGFIVAGAGPNILAKFDKNGDTLNLGDLDFTYTVE